MYYCLSSLPARDEWKWNNKIFFEALGSQSGLKRCAFPRDFPVFPEKEPNRARHCHCHRDEQSFAVYSCAASALSISCWKSLSDTCTLVQCVRIKFRFFFSVCVSNIVFAPRPLHTNQYCQIKRTTISRECVAAKAKSRYRSYEANLSQAKPREFASTFFFRLPQVFYFCNGFARRSARTTRRRTHTYTFLFVFDSLFRWQIVVCCRLTCIFHQSFFFLTAAPIDSTELSKFVS